MADQAAQELTYLVLMIDQVYRADIKPGRRSAHWAKLLSCATVGTDCLPTGPENAGLTYPRVAHVMLQISESQDYRPSTLT